ncbi:MAG: HesA/MoeB/ThiF family protein [Flavobacteriaceae bacterium]|nr:HesA/MoeB/ThiF family protein [Bacteroidia bacterium]NNL15336.1 HesA/MoeB/ThiF family protein [Flavobacteriaceae bacterium]
MERYKRQINLPQVGKTGQEKLRNSKILVIGAGGLGNAVLPYLSAAGIGHIGIIDGDKVEENNLQRQVLFTEKSIGHSKVDMALSKLKSLNSEVDIKIYDEYFSAKNAIGIADNYDIIIDATDTVSIRYLINDVCVLANKPFVYGSVYRFEGQVSVFNYKNGPTYRCLFKKKLTNVINCEDAGVLGTTVGIIGLLQANEVMKMILETGEILSGKLLLYNTLNNKQDIIKFKRDDSLVVNPEFYESEHLSNEIIHLTAKEAIKNDSHLMDVRELGELPEIESEKILKIPLSQLSSSLNQLTKDRPYAIFCQHGIRSLTATKLLKNNGFIKVKNIQDGALVIKKILENEKEKSIY